MAQLGVVLITVVVFALHLLVNAQAAVLSYDNVRVVIHILAAAVAEKQQFAALGQDLDHPVGLPGFSVQREIDFNAFAEGLEVRESVAMKHVKSLINRNINKLLFIL